jgi:hypothetical protein
MYGITTLLHYVEIGLTIMKLLGRRRMVCFRIYACLVV